MAEYLRSVKVTVEVDTNKSTRTETYRPYDLSEESLAALVEEIREDFG